jgi:hypothetical protein
VIGEMESGCWRIERRLSVTGGGRGCSRRRPVIGKDVLVYPEHKPSATPWPKEEPRALDVLLHPVAPGELGARVGHGKIRGALGLGTPASQYPTPAATRRGAVAALV